MLDKELKNDLCKIGKDYKAFCENKDKQSFFYFDQMTELFYNELLYEVNNKKILGNLIYEVFRQNINIIFKNMKIYINNISNDSIKMIDEIISISLSNKYMDLNDLDRLYKNFYTNVNKNFNLKEKITILINTNINHFKGELFSIFNFDDINKINQIIIKFQEIFKNEMINNVLSKKDNLISLYKNFIDNILRETFEKKEEIKNKNLELITNTALLYLKENSYINLNKNIKLNIRLINEMIDDLDLSLEKMGITKNKNIKLNPLKDYLLSFNNTISVKIKNFFDKINLIVTLDNKDINGKIKEVNDMITHIFEMNLVFDKKFIEYKKCFNTLSKKAHNVEQLFEARNRSITEGMKANIFNIFRSNIKIYNDVVYKTMLLKERIDEYNAILTTEKVKDLLFK